MIAPPSTTEAATKAAGAPTLPMDVLRTAGYDGGYQSMAALVDGALERELERLAIEFNDGEPFPRNAGGFRQGRPLGS